jgi:hypothetical protein
MEGGAEDRSQDRRLAQVVVTPAQVPPNVTEVASGGRTRVSGNEGKTKTGRVMVLVASAATPSTTAIARSAVLNPAISTFVPSEANFATISASPAIRLSAPKPAVAMTEPGLCPKIWVTTSPRGFAGAVGAGASSAAISALYCAA